jgi:Notch-like protein
MAYSYYCFIFLVCPLKTDCLNGGYGSRDCSSCICDLGYTGFYCESDIDECASSPCNNGLCVQTSQPYNYDCYCFPGFGGTYCENNVDDCLYRPKDYPFNLRHCANGGSCIDGIQSYTCLCPHGTTGKECELFSIFCDSDPCLNGGICTVALGVYGYSCTCTYGFTGLHCESETSVCNSYPCHNGGTCVDVVSTYSCSSVAGYTGTNCELPDITYHCPTEKTAKATLQPHTDPCLSIPCLNGGNCTNSDDHFQCQCLSRYVGAICEVDFISTCQERLNVCKSNPCFGHGQCVSTLNGYLCLCLEGLTGTRCETELNECLSTPCENGGHCMDRMGGYSCFCESGYTGYHCEVQIAICKECSCKWVVN